MRLKCWVITGHDCLHTTHSNLCLILYIMQMLYNASREMWHCYHSASPLLSDTQTLGRWQLVNALRLGLHGWWQLIGTAPQPMPCDLHDASTVFCKIVLNHGAVVVATVQYGKSDFSMQVRQSVNSDTDCLLSVG